MTEYFYRYRPASAVLDGFHELENQEIYFSTTEELNDPMEGFKDLFWQGDEIVWRNFLKHYILCILQAVPYCYTAVDNFDSHILEKIVFGTPQALPVAPIREIYERLSTEFLQEPAVQKFLAVLSGRITPIRRSELTSYLGALHGFAMQIINKEYRARGILAQTEGSDTALPETLRQSAIAMMEGIANITSSEFPPERIPEALFAASESTVAQALLIADYNFPNRDKQIPIAFLATRFPAAYIAALEKLVHGDWYVACFAKTAENHSMWSTYANGHRGVCLMFKTTANSSGLPTMAIERITGVGESSRGETYSTSEVAHELQAVSYEAKFPAIDFFRSLGSISTPQRNFWYLGEDGASSVCRAAVDADIDAWRKQYWQTFGDSALHKTPEWAAEEECRIVAHSMFDMSSKDKRKLKYRFKDLVGIVFGARTDIEDKLKILRIIDKKCAEEKRSDFKFLEIRYLHTESRFQLFSLDLLRIQHPAGDAGGA